MISVVMSSAYLDSGSGSLLPSLVGLAMLVFLVATAYAAKGLTERRGTQGWAFFLLVLFAFPIGVLATAIVVLAKRETGTT